MVKIAAKERKSVSEVLSDVARGADEVAHFRDPSLLFRMREDWSVLFDYMIHITHRCGGEEDDHNDVMGCLDRMAKEMGYSDSGDLCMKAPVRTIRDMFAWSIEESRVARLDVRSPRQTVFM